MDIHSQQGDAPRVLLGPAVTRLLRIRSIYFELVAVAILGFAGTAAPLFGNLYFVRRWGLDTAQRADVYSIIGLAAFLGLPVAYVLGDRYFRRAPQRPLAIAAACITAYGAFYVTSLYMPHLWMVVTLQFLANASVSPLAICIFLTLAATAPPEMRTICFAMFGVYSLVFGGFTGAVILGAISDAVGYRHGPTVALTLIGPVCLIGGHHARDRLPLRQARYHAGHRRRPRAVRRRPAAPGRGGGAGPAGPQPRLLLRRQPGAVQREPRDQPGGDPGPARHQRRRQVDTAPGRVGTGAPAPGGHPHLRSQLHLPRARADHRPGRGPAGRGQDDLLRPHRAGEPARRGLLDAP